MWMRTQGMPLDGEEMGRPCEVSAILMSVCQRESTQHLAESINATPSQYTALHSVVCRKGMETDEEKDFFVGAYLHFVRLQSAE